MKTALIIATYNWPEALELVLLSLTKQSIFPNEIIIADDGSTNQTKLVINSFKSLIKVPLIHVWQEDNGFQKAKILNKAILQSTADYIIQIDGDCIMHKNFIRDHINNAKKNVFLFGARVNIQQYFLDTLFEQKITAFTFYAKGIKKRTRAIYAPPLNKLYPAKNIFSKKYRGCNTSFFKADFIKVNGYNETFTGWGREDSELAHRFINLGVLGKRLRYVGIVFHIFHNEASKNNLNTNNHIETKTITQKLTWSDNGVDKYLDKI